MPCVNCLCLWIIVSIMEDDGRVAAVLNKCWAARAQTYKFYPYLLIDLVVGFEHHQNFKTLCLIFKTSFYWLIQVLNYTCFPTQGELRFQSRSAILTISLFKSFRIRMLKTMDPCVRCVSDVCAVWRQLNRIAANFVPVAHLWCMCFRSEWKKPPMPFPRHWRQRRKCVNSNAIFFLDLHSCEVENVILQAIGTRTAIPLLLPCSVETRETRRCRITLTLPIFRKFSRIFLISVVGAE